MATKPLGIKAYGHIPHIRGSRIGSGDKYIDPGQEKIVLEKTRDKRDLIIIQEKLDGSNCSVAKINGDIIALGRAGYTADSSPYDMHRYFAKWTERNKQRFDKILREGERVSGEWLMQAHGTRYNLLHEPFVPFDIIKKHDRLAYHDFLLRVLPQGFTVPRLIHLGQPLKLIHVLKKLEPSGHGALDPVEGAVFRCERDGKFDFICKFVRPEKQDGKYLPEISGQDVVWNVTPEELFKT